jgi:hypothetical protein
MLRALCLDMCNADHLNEFTIVSNVHIKVLKYTKRDLEWGSF